MPRRRWWPMAKDGYRFCRWRAAVRDIARRADEVYARFSWRPAGVSTGVRHQDAGSTGTIWLLLTLPIRIRALTTLEECRRQPPSAVWGFSDAEDVVKTIGPWMNQTRRHYFSRRLMIFPGDRLRR